MKRAKHINRLILISRANFLFYCSMKQTYESLVWSGTGLRSDKLSGREVENCVKMLGDFILQFT